MVFRFMELRDISPDFARTVNVAGSDNADFFRPAASEPLEPDHIPYDLRQVG
jgi:hypothetical protein